MSESDLADQITADVLEAQKLTRKHLVVELDFTPASVEELEYQFELVEYAIPGGLTEENQEILIRTWGAYLGEAIRREVGGEWAREAGESGERLVLRVNDQALYPLERVRLRLAGGAENSIWAYYQQTREQRS